MRALLCVFLTLFVFAVTAQSPQRPNVIIIITDDQGYGDFGWTGNPNVKTPAIDRLARESLRFKNFYVSPVCAPTRASLMTGRYSLRTGVHDTYNGGAMMATEEITIAEMLKSNGYVTGIFGKWHLGDNFPMRPMDQGFDESLIHLSGGMAQVGDFTTYFNGDSAYFDPVLWRNGKQESHTGYCSDVFAREAIRFVKKNRDQPFFCYLSFNAPHTPLQVNEDELNRYKTTDPLAGIPDRLQPPRMTEKDQEDARKVYAMVSNIDYNIGELLASLKKLNLEENTLVLFLTDNGPQQRRYTAGLRGLKGSVYEGGIRTPALLRFPALFKKGRDVADVVAHIDVLPTLAEICNTEIPSDRKIDGRSLVPVLTRNVPLPERSLFFYWTRKLPEKYSNVALRRDNYKLVANTDYRGSLPDFELYDMETDPFETHNLINDKTSVAAEMRDEMNQTFDELVFSDHLLHSPRIIVGSPEENPVVLNRNDASGDRGIWAQEEVFGIWKVKILPGTYNIRYRFLNPVPEGGRLILETGTVVTQMKCNTSADVISMPDVRLPESTVDIVTFYEDGSRRIFPFWVEFEKVN